ncbi:head-tail connector protein [Anaplasma capra]|uniref:head-tail connector protein n=1 Tax=Anaplasma capra TaxID=1562740 RepID=UPI0021D59847|nr:phage head-tail connector protein [Anaplasma capra]MCU7611666.1 phage head-tail connector protein [Anaplasma capra]MCU7612185.1 phage head-tail connector protein [Anaplasma capra]
MLENPAFHVARKAPPTSFPVTLMEAKSFLGISNSNEDDLLTSLISMSSEYAQWYIEQSLSKQTWVLSYAGSSIPNKIYLPFGPIISVIYVKAASDASDFDIIAAERYLVNNPQSNIVFPATLGATRMEIAYEAGYTDAKHVPMQIKNGILHHVAVSYKRRDAITVEHLTFIKEIYTPFREVKLVL